MFLHNIPLICTILLTSFHGLCNPTLIKEGLIDHHISISFTLCYSWRVHHAQAGLNRKELNGGKQAPGGKRSSVSVGDRSVWGPGGLLYDHDLYYAFFSCLLIIIVFLFLFLAPFGDNVGRTCWKTMGCRGYCWSKRYWSLQRCFWGCDGCRKKGGL